jgi:hypothetical protein
LSSRAKRLPAVLARPQSGWGGGLHSVTISQKCLSPLVELANTTNSVEVIDGAPSTPTRARSSPYYFTHIYSPRAGFQEYVLEPNFPTIANSFLVQRDIAKTMQK